MVRQGESRDSFSKRLGISPASLKRYENGERKADEGFLNRLILDQNLCRQWLLTGEGEMSASSTPVERAPIEPKMADTSAVLKGGKPQHIDSIDDRKSKMADTSVISCSAEQIFILQRELLAVTRQNGDLRVEVERLRMDVERRDARIADLERQLVEALKPRSRPPLLDKRGAAAG